MYDVLVIFQCKNMFFYTFLIAFLIRFHNFALPLRPNSTKWEIIIQKQGGLKGKPLYKNSYG